MAFDLTCDSCEFDREVDAEEDAYVGAKDHETDNPDHFVFIRSAR